VGQAFHFDGVSAAVEIPNAASLQPSSVTVEAWINLNSTSGTEMIAAKPIGTGGNGSYVLWWSNGALRGAISSSAASESAISATWTPTTGQWYHVAFTFDGPSNLGTLYLDGLAIASGTLNQTIGYDSQPLFLGGYSENGASQGYLNGLLDETSLYDRALTSAEIAQIFAAGSAGKALPGTADADIASGASLQNLLIYGLSLSANAAGANLSPGTVIYPDNSEHLAISFLRDPSRTDITLTVEATSDLQNWTTVATSTGGAPFTGTASISGEVAGTAPRTVTITDPTVPAGTPAKRFMKVTVSR